MVLRQKAGTALHHLGKAKLPTATSIQMPWEAVSTCVGVPTPQTMLSRAPGCVDSNQDCLSTLTWREREMSLCKRRGKWTRGKGALS